MATKKTEHETLGIDPGDALELGTPEPNQLATATEYHSFEGETDASDIQIPYLKLWQASCDEAKLEEPIGSLGAFLLNGLVVAERNNPLECIVLKARKFFREYIPYNERQPGVYAKTWNTKEEYEAEGFDKSQVNRALAMWLLVKKPQGIKDASTTEDDLDALFTIDFMGDQWTLARYTPEGNQYTGVGAPFIQFMMLKGSKLGSLPFRVQIGAQRAVSRDGKNSYAKAFLKFKPHPVEGQVEAIQEMGLLSAVAK